MTGLTERAWELPLLHQAQEALNSFAGPVTPGITDHRLLQQAYHDCEKLTAEHSRSFYIASALLPAEKRQAARALYAFCRVSDNIVDEMGEDAAEQLSSWRNQVLALHPPRHDSVSLAWSAARARYHIPWKYSEQLLDGVGRDLVQNRYQSFEELAAYAYGVASTVGLMSMHIIGFRHTEAIPYAVRLGVALQLTNILRDVGEDFAAGRVYLPQDELAFFGIGEEELAAGTLSDRWRRFMAFQIARNRRLYEEAWPGIGLLDPDGRLAIAAAAAFYRAILDDIEANDYDVFRRRAYVSTARKLRLMPGLWIRSRRSHPLY
jgi:phytoene synthase